jgi:hypothetical protein
MTSGVSRSGSTVIMTGCTMIALLFQDRHGLGIAHRVERADIGTEGVAEVEQGRHGDDVRSVTVSPVSDTSVNGPPIWATRRRPRSCGTPRTVVRCILPEPDGRADTGDEQADQGTETNA